MLITVRHTPKKFKLRDIRKATQFFAECLLGPRLTPNVEINIEFDDLGRYNGLCHAADPWRSGGPRVFDISINKNLGYKDTMTTLAHEMAHVKQFARKELKAGEGKVAYWFGKKWKVDDTNQLQYMFLPWEIEAVGYQNALVLCYHASLIQEKKK